MLPGLIKIGEEQPKETMKPLIEVAKEVYRVLTKTNRLVKEKLWRVPPAELLNSGGEVFFMYTCLDYTLTTGYLLRRMGISGHLVINELSGKEGAKIHFGVETPAGFIDHVIGNSSIIGTGELPNFYEPLKQEVQSARHRVDLSQIGGGDTIFDIIHRNGVKIQLLSEGIVAQLADKFEKDNTREVWDSFVRRSGGDIKNPTLYLQQ